MPPNFRAASEAMMSEERITRRSVTDRRKGKTDLDRLRAMSEEEIEKAIRQDPDSDPTNFDWSNAELVMPRRKGAISIRLLDPFKNRRPFLSRARNTPTKGRR